MRILLGHRTTRIAGLAAAVGIAAALGTIATGPSVAPARADTPSASVIPAGESLYVASGFDLFRLGADGSVIRAASLPGYPLEQIAADPSGNVYVVTPASPDLFRIDPTGTTAILWPDVSVPTAVATDAAGNIYVNESSAGAAQVGDVVRFTPDATRTVVADDLRGNESVTVDAAGDPFVLQSSTTGGSGSAVDEYLPDGSVREQVGTNGSCRTDLPASQVIGGSVAVTTTGTIAVQAQPDFVTCAPDGTTTVDASDPAGPDGALAADGTGDLFAATQNGVVVTAPNGTTHLIPALGLMRSSITVGPTIPLSVTGTAPVATVGTAIAPFAYTLTGLPQPTVSVTGGALPDGLSLSPSGQLSGTPTEAGSFTVQLTATNGIDPDVTDTATITVDGPPAFTAATPPTTATVGTPYSYTYAASGYPAPTFTATGLPAGLTLTPAGVLSGTPTAAGTATVNVTASNSAGSVSTSSTITVAPAARPVNKADVQVTLSRGGPGSGGAGAGSVGLVTLTVTNVGPATAKGVLANLVLPAGERFQSATGAATHVGQAVLWKPIDLPAGATTSYTVRFAGTAARRTATMGGALSLVTPDPDLRNNVAVMAAG